MRKSGGACVSRSNERLRVDRMPEFEVTLSKFLEQIGTDRNKSEHRGAERHELELRTLGQLRILRTVADAARESSSAGADSER